MFAILKLGPPKREGRLCHPNPRHSNLKTTLNRHFSEWQGDALLIYQLAHPRPALPSQIRAQRSIECNVHEFLHNICFSQSCSTCTDPSLTIAEFCSIWTKGGAGNGCLSSGCEYWAFAAMEATVAMAGKPPLCLQQQQPRLFNSVAVLKKPSVFTGLPLAVRPLTQVIPICANPA